MKNNYNLLMFIILFCLLYTLVPAKKIGLLPKLEKPTAIKICDEGIYIFDKGTNIHKYTHKDLKLIKSFCKKGEGPGEIKKTPFNTNNILLLPDKIFVDCVDKILFFSKKGKLLEERKKTNQFALQMFPVGKNFVSKELVIRADGKSDFMVIYIYDNKMKNKKEIFRQVSPVQLRQSVDLMLESLYFCVVDNKVFIEDGKSAFLIHVYDQNGEKLYQIKNKHTEIRITESEKKNALDFYKADPNIKKAGFERLKQKIKFTFPEHLAVIQSLSGFNKGICVKLHSTDNKNKFMIMDLKGKVLRTIFPDSMESPSLMARIDGIVMQPYTVYNGKFYYLIVGEESEEWELHIL